MYAYLLKNILLNSTFQRLYIEIPVSSVHRLVWAPASSAVPGGLLVGGADEGQISVYNAGAMMGYAKS